VRCPRCNSENPPEYRFCGMCGTPLDKPAEAPVRSAESVRPVERTRPSEPAPPPSTTLSGPSFLGLSQPARGTEDVTYLFEEEQPRRTYWRFMLLLLFLAIIGGLGYLQYTRSGKSWTAPWANQKPTTPEQATQQPPPPATPAQNPAQPPAANQPANGQPPAQNAPGNPPQPKETDIAPGATPPAGGQAPATPPPAANASPAPAQPEQAPANAEARKESQPAPDSSKIAKNEAAAKDEAAADQPDTTEETPAPKPKRVKPAPVPATNPDDALVTNAEKYLYGRGVPQNCDRALVSLRAAADRQNTRAQSLLGTMYGTGHCVPRDLPNAYRWFALASRQQGDNMWIQRNLEMIWREMTPQERQLAMQSNR
jgi:zinc-ribbon domain/Sel1 repeat